MRTWINTTVVPRAKWEVAMRWVAPPLTPYTHLIALRSIYPVRGNAWPRGTFVWGRPRAIWNTPLIVARLGGDHHFPTVVEGAHPHHYQAELRSPSEAIVWILAHELRHVWQAAWPEAPRIGGEEGWSELDAEVWAAHKLDQWRREYDPIHLNRR